jgi:hypothetical protein
MFNNINNPCRRDINLKTQSVQIGYLFHAAQLFWNDQYIYTAHFNSSTSKCEFEVSSDIE